jgi:glycerophosphoryl diester phosphodiesterase
MNPAKTIPLAAALLTACAETTSARNDDRPLVIAHRGASFLAPEHTIAAYDRAIADGADYIELDLARTSDGAVVVIHDSSLDRTARGPAGDCGGEVRDKTYAQLLRCDFGAWFNERYPDRARNEYRGLRILTLEEVIARYRDRAGLYIEIKTPELYPGIESRLAASLGSSGLTGGKRPALVQSFNVESLLTLRDIDPSILLVILSGTDVLPDLSQLRRFATGLGLPAPAVSAELVRLAHDQCIAVFPYGGDSRLRELIDLGVDGIFTDRPDLLRNIVDESDKTVPDFSGCSAR